MDKTFSMKDEVSGAEPEVPEGYRQTLKSPLISRDALVSLRSGDHKAFEEVFLVYFEKVKHFIVLLIGSMDTAEEMTQDIFVNLWQNRDKIDPEKSFNAYIYTIARNTVYNYAKSKSVREKYANSFWEIDYAVDAEEIFIEEETKLLIEIAVSRMPKQRRKIFELHKNDGLSREEVAKALNITKNAVDKQLRSAISTIQEILGILVAFFLVDII